MTARRLTLTMTAWLLLIGVSAYAQGNRAPLTGTVTDSGGGIIPGATVAVKNNATNVTINTVTNNVGLFSVPALEPGTYTVTVSLSGFKTAAVNDVHLVAATPLDLKVVLEVGQLSETVTVEGAGAELVQTTSPTIATTINADQINRLPLPTRNALNFVTFLPGVETTGIARDSTVNGLPQGTISISLDGVNIQDNYLKTSDGFFARVYPRQDAIEEVTVTAATQGADAAGQGAVQIRFQTRSGTNKYDASVYHYYRSPKFNSNYFFNELNGLEKNRVILHQYGFRVGGPIVIPGVYDGHGKAFFFVNHEEFYNPSQATRTRTIFRETARSGVFQYNITSGGVTTTRAIDMYAVANQFNQQCAAGLIANCTIIPGVTPDPTVGSLLAAIRASTGVTGVTSDLADVNTQRFVFQNSGAQRDHQPTVKVDYNFGTKHRLSASYVWLHVLRNPDFLNSADPAFPNFPNYRTQDSYRPSASSHLRSTFTPNIVNEVTFGGSWGPTHFGRNVTPDTFNNQGGYSLGINTVPNANNAAVSSATISNGPSARAANNIELNDTLNWQRGRHSVSFGGSFTQIRLWLTNWSVVPAIAFGVNDADPLNQILTTGSFPGASTSQLDDAEDLFAVLTGRVSGVNGTSRLNGDTGQYDYLGKLVNRDHMNEYGVFAQDSWRVRPNLTLTGGLRWELQMPFVADNGVMTTATFADLCGVSGVAGDGKCNIFQPGTLTGQKPKYVQYTSATKGYKIDFNNIAPNIGVAWQPNVQSGFMRKLMGDPAQATIRAGYSVAYNRNGIGDFTDVYTSNPGDSVTANRNSNNGNLFAPGRSYLLMREGSSVLGPPPVCPAGVVSVSCVPAAPTLPITGTASQDLNIFDPTLQVSFSRSYSIGFQRSLGRSMAFEIRYVGTRNVAGWTTENWNETNIIENHFLDEFRLAQANLASHVAAGCGTTGQPACSIAYRGPGTGSFPLPTYFAYINGTSGTASNAASYTGTLWTNNTLVGRHGLRAPSPTGAASDIFGSDTRRTNALNAGLPANFFVLNPDAGQANITQSESFSKYHSLQTELRRRLSRGLAVTLNYTYSRRWGSSFLGQRYGRTLLRSTGNPHAFKTTWNYEVPVGRARRFGANLPTWLDAALGGWSFDGTGRWQSRTVNFGNVRLVGMSLADVEKEYYVRINRETKTVSYLPDDIILNTRRAFSTSATSVTGYGSLGAPENRYFAPANGADCYQLKSGDCAPIQNFINAPWFARFDMSVKKRFRLGGRVTGDIQFDVLNVFDAINFNPVANPGNGATIFQTTSAYQDLSNTFDPGGRLGQFVWRISF